MGFPYSSAPGGNGGTVAEHVVMLFPAEASADHVLRDHRPDLLLQEPAQPGRLVVPKVLRYAVGLRPGPVTIDISGSGLRIEPLVGDELVEEGGRLVIPASGTPIDDATVCTLQHADRRSLVTGGSRWQGTRRSRPTSVLTTLPALARRARGRLRSRAPAASGHPRPPRRRGVRAARRRHRAPGLASMVMVPPGGLRRWLLPRHGRASA